MRLLNPRLEGPQSKLAAAQQSALVAVRARPASRLRPVRPRGRVVLRLTTRLMKMVRAARRASMNSPAILYFSTTLFSGSAGTITPAAASRQGSSHREQPTSAGCTQADRQRRHLQERGALAAGGPHGTGWPPVTGRRHRCGQQHRVDTPPACRPPHSTPWHCLTRYSRRSRFCSQVKSRKRRMTSADSR